LVVAPARVADTVWHAEAAQWPLGQRVGRMTGSPTERLDILKNPFYDILTVSYENLTWLLSVCDLPKRFDAIVFDELSKMKSPGASRFRRMRKPIRNIPIRIGLTGTPVGNHLQDIWGEMFMVADEKPLGPTFSEFQVHYFVPVASKNNVVIKWAVRPGAQAEIHRRVKPWAFTLASSAPLPLPELRQNLIDVVLPARVEEQAKELARDLRTALDSGADLTTFSSTTAAMKIRQIVGGAVYTEGEKWEAIHGSKLMALEELAGELQGQPLMVGYWFKHEAERIMAHFQGVSRKLETSRDIDAWNRGEVEILLIHPASAGHGLNLQYGGHHLCWYTLPWSLEMLKQTRGRLVRTGQKSPYVMEHVLHAGALDEVVWAALGRKRTTEDDLLAAMLG
jgi:SNF2 family DNA or RNA helicase